MIRYGVLALALFVVGCAAPPQPAEPEVAVACEARIPIHVDPELDEPVVQSMRIDVHTVETPPATVHVDEDGLIDVSELMMAVGWARGVPVLVSPEVDERVSYDTASELGLLEGVTVVH